MTADAYYAKHPADYRKALSVLSDAHMNPKSTPADVLEALVPILTRGGSRY